MMNQNTAVMDSSVDEEQMTDSENIEGLLDFFSDLYKDVNGIRPRWMYDKFRAMTQVERIDTIQALVREIDEANKND